MAGKVPDKSTDDILKAIEQLIDFLNLGKTGQSNLDHIGMDIMTELFWHCKGYVGISPTNENWMNF